MPTTTAERMATERADAVVIGAGLGGLLAAVRLAGEGRRVVVLERADRAGGRFTATPVRGAEVSTGALHLVPSGPGGALARLLRELRVPVAIAGAEVICSIWMEGRQLGCHRHRDLLRILPSTERRAALRLAAELVGGRRGSAEAWLGGAVGPDARLYQLWRAFTEFALSLPLERVQLSELRHVVYRMLRDGPPGIPRGGCRGVIDALVAELESRGGCVLLERAAETIRTQPDLGSRPEPAARVTAVEARHRRTGERLVVEAPLVVSDIGAEATLAIAAGGEPAPGLGDTGDALPRAAATRGRRALDRVRPATGLKIQLLSPISVVPHRSVMFCLGTERVAGIVQPSNGDPGLAPPGKHLVMSHQVLRGDSIAEGREAGLGDLRRILGAAFADCEILSVAGFRDAWPVNRVAQGEDVLRQPLIRGLLWVGDGHKPPGYIMVEGVAESVRRLRLPPVTPRRRYAAAARSSAGSDAPPPRRAGPRPMAPAR